MRLNLLGAVLAASLAFTACAPTTINTPAPGSTATAPANLRVGQALFAAETAYNIPAHAYLALEGSLAPEVKARAKAALLDAYTALTAARSAAAAGDTVAALFQASEASRLAAAAKSLLPQT